MGNIRKRFSCIFLVIMLVCLTACNKGEAGNNSGNAGEKGSEGVNAGNISEDNTNNTANVAYTPIKMSDDFKADKEELALYESLFSSDSKIKVTVDISDEELRKIQEDYDRYSSKGSKSPIYRKCNMTFEINGEKYTIEEVGVRMYMHLFTLDLALHRPLIMKNIMGKMQRCGLLRRKDRRERIELLQLLKV